MSSQKRAIADRIDQEHEDIRRSMGQLELTVMQRVSEEKFPDWRLSIILEVRDFQSQLLKHFDVEEKGGFMHNVLTAMPHAEHQVDALKDEHQELILHIEQILDKLRSLQKPSVEIQQEIHQDLRDLKLQILQHEEQEQILLRELFYPDTNRPE